MRKNISLVEKVQGTETTQTKNNKYYWVNRFSPRFGLMSSTPYDTLDDAVESVTDMVRVFGQFADKKLAFKQTGAYQWENGRGILMAISTKGSLCRHMEDIWITHSATVALEEGLDCDSYVVPSEELLYVLGIVHALQTGSVAEKDKVVEDIIRRYYTDDETKEIFDNRAKRLAKATTNEEVLYAVFSV